MKQILRNTKIAVLASIVLSCLSYFTTQKGWSEIYPFYFWKLYSQPAGWAKKYVSYRVYAKKDADTSWTRLQNQTRATFNKDETLYFLNPIIVRLKEKETAADLKKLKVFCTYIAPEFDQYKIVAEAFNPLDIDQENFVPDTSTVVNVPK